MKILTKIISSYSFSYIRSLLYILQSSEYYLKSFLVWVFRVHDFRKVENRKKLIWTTKIKILFSLLLFFNALYIFYFSNSILILFFAFIFLPTFNLLFLIFLNLIFSFLQKIPEKYLINKAKKKLKKITAFKIAIAGSYGKTSTREILKSVLEVEKKVASVKENYNTPIGIANFILSLNGDEEILIFELGEYYRGDVKFLAELIKPDLGIITGINESHIERFGNLKNTISTIFELSDYLNNENIFVNFDDKNVVENVREKNLIYGKFGTDDFKVLNFFTDLNGLDFEVLSKKDNIKIKFHSSILGEHNLGSLILAIQIAEKLFFKNESIETGIKKVKSFKNRMELKKITNDIILIDDTYNGNLDGIKAGLKFVGNISNYNVIYITPGLVEIGKLKEEIHIKIGEEIGKYRNIKKVVLINNSVKIFVKQGLKNTDYNGQIIYFDSVLEALQKINTYTLGGEVVLAQNDWGDNYN
jgi:UDP-N-acetylmuramoyl-tripeptide--D-alanyl-D-alanine ligase